MSYEAYGGETSFLFNVERFQDSKTKLLYSLKELENFDEDKEFEIIDVELTVKGKGYYNPGFTGGAPENCYPSDSDLEIISIVDKDNLSWEDKISSTELDQIKDALINELKGF
jgi:hypothetical protein